jgi:hypothetical protein
MLLCVRREAGIPAAEIRVDPRPVTPQFLQRSPLIGREMAEGVVAALQGEGLLDEVGPAQIRPHAGWLTVLQPLLLLPPLLPPLLLLLLPFQARPVPSANQLMACCCCSADCGVSRRGSCVKTRGRPATSGSLCWRRWWAATAACLPTSAT